MSEIAQQSSSFLNLWISRSFFLNLTTSRKHPWRGQWHPTPVLLPGKSHGQRSLVGCSPWGLEELDTTELLHFHFSLQCFGEGNGNPLQCSCLENPWDSRAWWAAVYGVEQSQPRLKWFSSSRKHPSWLTAHIFLAPSLQKIAWPLHHLRRLRWDISKRKDSYILKKQNNFMKQRGNIYTPWSLLLTVKQSFFLPLGATLRGGKKRTMRYWAFLRVYSKLEPPPHYYPSFNIEENLKETRTALHFLGQDHSHLGLESVSEFKAVCWRQECCSGVYNFPSLWLTLLAHSLEVFPLLEFHYISQWPVLKVPSVLKFSSQDQICALEITSILESGVQISDLFLPGIFLHSKPWRL